MLVAKRMSKDPEIIAPDDYLAGAQAKMHEGRFHRLPVVKEGKLVGIITDRGLREHKGFLEQTKVSTVMTGNVMTVTPRLTVEKAAQLMLSHNIGGFPVTEEGKLVGVITRSDILQAFLDVMGASGEGSARIDFLLQGGHDLSLAAKIIAEEGAEVLSVGTHKEGWDEDRVCYLHLRGSDPNDLAEVLKRKGYTVLGVHA